MLAIEEGMCPQSTSGIRNKLILCMDRSRERLSSAAWRPMAIQNPQAAQGERITTNRCRWSNRNQCGDQQCNFLVDSLCWHSQIAIKVQNAFPALRAKVSDHSRAEGTAGLLRALALCQWLTRKTGGPATTEQCYQGVGLCAAKRLISSCHSRQTSVLLSEKSLPFLPFLNPLFCAKSR
jgi:hypothetical protein